MTDLTDDDEIEALVAALRATGWDRPTTIAVLAAEDRAAAEALFGATNARRMANAPRGTRVRMVRTSEVYAVRNSRGWLVGAIEGKRNRVLYEALTSAECAKVISFARDRGHHVVEYANPAPPRLDLPEAPRAARDRQSTSPKPSRRHDILQQLARFRA